MKLSSTKKTLPRYPVAFRWSSSVSTWAGVLVRGLRPKTSMMSQNSHWKGQPREYCTLIDAYRRWSMSSKRGAGTISIDGRSSPSGESSCGAGSSLASSARTRRSSLPSASPRKTCWASGKAPGSVFTAGPPTTVRLLSARARVRTRRMPLAWMSIPVTSTASAHRSASSVSGSTFSSTTRISHSRGRRAARLISPRGGSEAAFPAMGRLCWKPQ